MTQIVTRIFNNKTRKMTKKKMNYQKGGSAEIIFKKIDIIDRTSKQLLELDFSDLESLETFINDFLDNVIDILESI